MSEGPTCQSCRKVIGPDQDAVGISTDDDKSGLWWHRGCQGPSWVQVPDRRRLVHPDGPARDHRLFVAAGGPDKGRCVKCRGLAAFFVAVLDSSAEYQGTWDQRQAELLRKDGAAFYVYEYDELCPQCLAQRTKAKPHLRWLVFGAEPTDRRGDV